ncbi:MAG: phospholipase D-like domain-containing protein [Firmicutes bacterium]|nr:phospholipase D-like domain-containing protein [Bacillota bacterium]
MNRTLKIRNSVLGVLTTLVVYGLLFLVQLALLFYVGRFLGEHRNIFQNVFFIFDFIIGLHIVNDKQNDPTYKIAFLFTMIVLPIFGSFLYILSKWDVLRRWFSEKFQRTKQSNLTYFRQNPEIMEETRREDPLFYNTARFLWNEEDYPVYRNGDCDYFPLGEDYWPRLCEELRKAKKFIFMEYFIIEQGEMWGSILEILREKVDEGVEVRVMFDGTSAVTKLPFQYAKAMREIGIQTKVFKPIVPLLSLYQNHRDHRKIAVIDNRVAFTGGINLADEYVNVKEVYGHWKDTGIAVYGNCVRSFTNMFLAMWDVVSKGDPEDFKKYLIPLEEEYRGEHSGYIIPFGDDPYGKNRVGKEVYNDMITQATSYLHVTTPYLILDEETKGNLIHLAQTGTQVRIITPHIPDKRVVFLVTRSYYKELLKNGVEIYEYTPGFIHAKNFVSDGTKTVVGTVNCDYRSFFLHFECGAYFYDRTMAEKVEEDFEETLSLSMPFTLEMCREFSIWERAAGRLLRILAPMM